MCLTVQAQTNFDYHLWLKKSVKLKIQNLIIILRFLSIKLSLNNLVLTFDAMLLIVPLRTMIYLETRFYEPVGLKHVYCTVVSWQKTVLEQGLL